MPDSLEIHYDPAPLADEWEALARRLGAAPFLWPGWISAWFDAFGRGELILLTVRRESKIAGVLPVMRRRGALSSATNWHTPLYGPVAIDEKATSTMLDGLFSLGRRRIDIGFLDAGDPTVRLTPAASGAYRVTERTILRSPYVVTSGGWGEYWSARSPNLRKSVNRCRNRLEDRGPVKLEVSDGRGGLERLLEEGFHLEGSGWKERAGTAINSRPETRRFYERIAAWAAQAGLLRLAFLRAGDRRVAFNLTLETDSHHYLLKLGHDMDFHRAGPGTVLASEMIARAFRLKRTYEFLGSNDDYKMRWASGCRERVRLQAFAPTPWGVIDGLVQTQGKAAARRLMSLRG
jgi:CelD/BcsL family acetyltransferase involved in cellulose biosynthesis